MICCVSGSSYEQGEIPIVNQFEVHLTVLLADQEALKRLETWAITKHAKVAHIVLDRGNHSSQPMVTYWFKGRWEEARAAVRSTAMALEREGFEVHREKIEVDWESDLVPRSEQDLLSFSPDSHFEFHIKLRLQSSDCPSLERAVKGTQARLSRNARRVLTNGSQERFVTLRCYGVTKSIASQQLEEIMTRLDSPNWEVLEIEKEFVVFDSNLALDSGWIEIPRGERDGS